MALNKEQRMALIEFLAPLLGDESKRRTYFDLVFVDHRSRQPDINLHGTPRNVTTQMVMELERFQLEPGKPALVDFLDLIKRWDVGDDKHAQIEAWQTALLTSAAPVPQSPSIPTLVGEQHAAPIMPSRTEQFSLPEPFEWITIPAGQVMLEGKNESYLKTETTFDVAAFAISKYPITVEQFWTFSTTIYDYKNQDLWTKKGQRWLKDSQSSLIKIDHSIKSYQPTTVTWYEAMAFCAWLRKKTGDKIYLPTEKQWQRAAQGDDSRLYPWGNDWHEDRCNNNVGSRKKQGYTVIIQYEGQDKGNSPYGVVDMVGNAAEWCLTSWKTGEQGGDGEDPRVVRGGSYQNQHLNFYRVTTRHKEWPTEDCGFRIVRLLDT